MASAETARLIASLELQDKNFTRGLKNVERGISKVDRRLGAVSGAVNRNLARGIDTVISKGSEFLTGTVKDAADFETAITGVAKTVTGDISAVTDELKTMSTQIPLSFVELAGIAELGGAMGIAKDDLVAFTEQVAILGTTTNVSTEDAATALGQLQNVIGLTGDEFDNFAASLVDLGNKGASTESAILEIAKRSGGAAKLIGVAKEETLGWAAAAANLGLNEELAGTALQNLFIKGAKSQAKLAKVAGVNVKKFEKLWAKDATGALQLFLKELGKLDQNDQLKAVEDIFGKGSGLTRLILGLANDEGNLTDSLEIGTKAWKEAVAAQEEAEKRFKTSESLFKRLDNSVKIVSATIGEALLPVLNELATEAIDFLSKPETQKGIKNFAKSIGEGVRGLAGIITSINWGAVAGFLGTAAGFAGQLVGWFSKMPDWAQAFLIGGFAVTKLPIIGDIVTSALKGALGITAGIVNVNGPVAGGGVPGGAPAGGASKLANAVRILGAVSIAGASLIALAEVFRGFQETVTTAQQDLLEKVNATSEQGFKETIANLEATNAGIKNMNPLENVLAGIFGGSEIQKNLEMAADRLATLAASGELSQSQMADALAALKETRETNPELSLPETDAAIKALTAAINKKFVGPPKPETKPRVAGVGDRPSPGNPGEFKRNIDKIGFDKWLTKADNIKNAVTTTGADQKAELSNIKNATTTMDTNTKAGLLANTTVAVVGNVAAAFQSASQLLATGSTTTAVNNGAAATRGVAPPITGAISSMSGAVVGAIWAARPVIQSTTVVNSYGTAQRGGATSDSRAGGGRHG